MTMIWISTSCSSSDHAVTGQLLSSSGATSAFSHGRTPCFSQNLWRGPAHLASWFRGGGAAGQTRRGRVTLQSCRTHATALTCQLAARTAFLESKRLITAERFGCMGAGGSKKRGGLAPSSALKDTKTDEEAASGKVLSVPLGVPLNAKRYDSSCIRLAAGNAPTLVTFETKDGQSAVGVVREGSVWPLQDLLSSSDRKPLPQINDMAAVINNWSDLKDRLSVKGRGTQLAEVKLLAPIPRPTGVILCIGKNYLDHVKEVDTGKIGHGSVTSGAPKHPIVFTKAPQSVIGTGAAIKYPHGVSSAVDYEAELAVIIGKSGQKIERKDAMSHIFGYTILNDVTARDLQRRHQQWFLGKSCDTFCPMGPGIVLASEIDGNNLQIQCWVNDELRQDGRTSQMIFGIPELIEVISAATTLQPGDIIATGTPAGVGSGFNPPRHLVAGDKIRIRIEGIGELMNTVE